MFSMLITVLNHTKVLEKKTEWMCHIIQRPAEWKKWKSLIISPVSVILKWWHIKRWRTHGCKQDSPSFTCQLSSPNSQEDHPNKDLLQATQKGLSSLSAGSSVGYICWNWQGGTKFTLIRCWCECSHRSGCSRCCTTKTNQIIWL